MKTLNDYKEEYNKLCEVLSLNERRNDEEKSTKATELKEKLVKRMENTDDLH